MVLSKANAAKVAAYYTGWVNPEQFADYAEKGLVYQQWHYLARKETYGFFVIGINDKEFPAVELTDTSIDNLTLVLPEDVVSPDVILKLSSIEINRRPRKSEKIFEIVVVRDVGKDPSSGEIKYRCDYFYSTKELIKQVQGDGLSAQADQPKLNLPKSNKVGSVTLIEVNRFVTDSKKRKV